MRRLLLVIFLSLPMLVSLSPLDVAAQSATSCTNYDAWEWANLEFASDPIANVGLAPDANGEVCPELPRGGFAPAIWTDEIPEDVQEAELIRIIDGDTFEMLIDGVSNRVRIYRADTPETQNESHCGGEEATAFAEYALSLNDNSVVYLERDENERDRFGRELAYIWFEVDSQPYLLNHILIATGWAEDLDYGDRKYDEEFIQAAEFALDRQIGVYDLCGAFELSLGDSQSEPIAIPSGDGGGQADPSYTEPVVEAPVMEAPVEAAPAAGCDPSYPDVCIAVYPPDLNCGDVTYTNIRTVPPDPHGFDGDSDGVGCEG